MNKFLVVMVMVLGMVFSVKADDNNKVFLYGGVHKEYVFNKNGYISFNVSLDANDLNEDNYSDDNKSVLQAAYASVVKYMKDRTVGIATMKNCWNLFSHMRVLVEDLDRSYNKQFSTDSGFKNGEFNVTCGKDRISIVVKDRFFKSVTFNNKVFDIYKYKIGLDDYKALCLIVVPQEDEA